MAVPAGRSSVVLIALIAVLLPALAVLQYRWLGELSGLEQIRAQNNIRAATARFSQDFDAQLAGIFTLNYGLRLERETGMYEANDQQTVGFDTTTISPLDSRVNVIDPITGQRRQLNGGLQYAGVDGAPRVQGNQPAVKLAPRIGAVYSMNDKTVLRGGWGLYWAPWNYAAAGTNGWGQIGYSATTPINQPSGGVPNVTIDNPFPSGLIQPSGSSLGLLTGAGTEIRFVDPNKGAPRVQQYSVDMQRELPGDMSVLIGYMGLTGSNLSWGGTSNALININQLDPKYQASGIDTLAQVPNPFFGVLPANTSRGAQSTTQRRNLLVQYPQFSGVTAGSLSLGSSWYNAFQLKAEKRMAHGLTVRNQAVVAAVGAGDDDGDHLALELAEP